MGKFGKKRQNISKEKESVFGRENFKLEMEWKEGNAAWQRKSKEKEGKIQAKNANFRGIVLLTWNGHKYFGLNIIYSFPK